MESRPHHIGKGSPFLGRTESRERPPLHNKHVLSHTASDTSAPGTHPAQACPPSVSARRRPLRRSSNASYTSSTVRGVCPLLLTLSITLCYLPICQDYPPGLSFDGALRPSLCLVRAARTSVTLVKLLQCNRKVSLNGY